MEAKQNIINKNYAKLLFIIGHGTGKKYVSALAKKVGIVYTHMFKIVSMFEKRGVIETEKIGRKRTCKLTEKGKIISEKLEEIRNLID